MSSIEQRIGQAIGLVWVKAIKWLKLNTLQRPPILAEMSHLVGSHAPPTNKIEHRKLVRIHNILVEQHQKLELDASILLMHTFDPSCLNDSAHRLTQSVANWLLAEISTTERLLKESETLFLPLRTQGRTGLRTLCLS
jgi:hypothetical protein